MKLTKTAYPAIFKGFDLIIADNVANHTIVTKIKHKLKNGFEFEADSEFIDAAERFASQRSKEELELVCMGDQDDAETLFGRMPGYNEVNQIFSEFFNNM